VARRDTKTEVNVTLNIVVGRHVSEYQRRCWLAFWRKITAAAKSAAKETLPVQAPDHDARNDSGEKEISGGRE
jgi:hypothetical protein